ncbi:MAG: hypothetical protein ABIQ93_11995, partial [Saprospiraceae bacterium]
MVFFSALFLLFSCKKEKDPALSLDLSGRYIGKTVSTSLHQEEIFTSPTESHYEWFHDSATYAPDTLTVTQLGT